MLTFEHYIPKTLRFWDDMKNRIELSDEEWQAIYRLLLLNQRIYID
jgi:hypothetical protein